MSTTILPRRLDSVTARPSTPVSVKTSGGGDILVLTPNNTVQWKYSRTFTGGKVAGNTQLYAIATDRSLLGRPETPKIPPRSPSQSAADYKKWYDDQEKELRPVPTVTPTAP